MLLYLSYKYFFFPYFQPQLRCARFVRLHSLWPSLSFSCHHHICSVFFLFTVSSYNGWSLVCRVDEVDIFFFLCFLSFFSSVFCFHHVWDLFLIFFLSCAWRYRVTIANKPFAMKNCLLCLCSVGVHCHCHRSARTLNVMQFPFVSVATVRVRRTLYTYKVHHALCWHVICVRMQRVFCFIRCFVHVCVCVLVITRALALNTERREKKILIKID